MMSQRIEYIDRLKGVAMILVVTGHIIIFCGLGYNNTYVNNIVLINMPLFLFLNGLVCKKASGLKSKYILQKFIQIMLPFLVWGLIATIYRNENYINFFTNFWKFGYWYLIVLYELLMIYYICVSLARGINSIFNNRNNNFVTMFLILILGYFVVRLGIRLLPDTIKSITSYFQILDYYPYFFMGVLIKNFNLSNYFLRKSSLIMTILIPGVCLFYYLWNHTDWGAMMTLPLRFSFILLIYNAFMLLGNTITSENVLYRILNNTLSTIGKHTMAIYMLQFYLFSWINYQSIYSALNASNNYLCIIVLSGISAIVLCYICISIEKLIQFSRPLCILLLGKQSMSLSN